METETRIKTNGTQWKMKQKLKKKLELIDKNKKLTNKSNLKLNNYKT